MQGFNRTDSWAPVVIRVSVISGTQVRVLLKAFIIKPYAPSCIFFLPCQEDYDTTVQCLEKVTFSLFSFFSFSGSGISPVPTLHNQFSNWYPSIGLHSVVSTVLLGCLINNEILFFSIFLESVFKCFFSCQLNSILFPEISNNGESFLLRLKEESKGQLNATRDCKTQGESNLCSISS